MADGQVIFEIKGDNSGVKDSLKDTTKAIQDESKKWDSAVDDSSGTISSSLIGAFKAVTASAAFVKIAQMLLQLGAESVSLASDLEEVQNVVDVTFGTEGSKKIETWAKQAQNQFGLTELQAKQYASTLGAMMKSNGMTDDQIYEMSTQLAGLAADMASFYNMDFDTAFSKIQSGITGMTLPLRQLGIDMTESSIAAFSMSAGFEKSYKDMSEAEQMIVRYQYLMKMTSDAQGDFARTSDSYANSQRRLATNFDTLKSQLGEALLPIATAVTNAVNDLLELLTYTPPETAFDIAEKSMSDAAGTAVQAQGILGYMDQLYQKYGDAATKTDEWAAALGRLKEVMPGVNEFIDQETGALTASNEQLKQYIENSKQAAIEKAKQTAVQSLNDQYVQANMDYYTQEINRDLAYSQADEAAYQIIDYLISASQKQAAEMGYELSPEDLDRESYMQSLHEDSSYIDRLLTSAYELASFFGDDTSVLERYGEIYSEQQTAAASASSEMDRLSGVISGLETDLAVAEAALGRMAAAAGAASDALSGIGGGGLASGFSNGVLAVINGSHAGGLNYVPADNYLALLHRGERVQTAAEASLYRMYGSGQPQFNYGTLGAAMWDNAPALGGNVYLDGRTVGQVLSDQQGKSYRALQRSGWQG